MAKPYKAEKNIEILHLFYFTNLINTSINNQTIMGLSSSI